VIATDIVSDYKVDYLPRDTLSEGRGGEVLEWNRLNIDYEVEVRPRDTLSEGRGW
jgi:hypothetical protein